MWTTLLFEHATPMPTMWAVQSDGLQLGWKHLYPFCALNDDRVSLCTHPCVGSATYGLCLWDWEWEVWRKVLSCLATHYTFWRTVRAVVLGSSMLGARLVLWCCGGYKLWCAVLDEAEIALEQARKVGPNLENTAVSLAWAYTNSSRCWELFQGGWSVNSL